MEVSILESRSPSVEADPSDEAAEAPVAGPASVLASDDRFVAESASYADPIFDGLAALLALSDRDDWDGLLRSPRVERVERVESGGPLEVMTPDGLE